MYPELCLAIVQFLTSRNIIGCHVLLQMSMSASPSPSAVTASVLTTPEVMNVRVILGSSPALTCVIAPVSTSTEPEKATSFWLDGVTEWERSMEGV